MVIFAGLYPNTATQTLDQCNRRTVSRELITLSIVSLLLSNEIGTACNRHGGQFTTPTVCLVLQVNQGRTC